MSAMKADATRRAEALLQARCLPDTDENFDTALADVMRGYYMDDLGFLRQIECPVPICGGHHGTAIVDQRVRIIWCEGRQVA